MTAAMIKMIAAIALMFVAMEHQLVFSGTMVHSSMVGATVGHTISTTKDSVKKTQYPGLNTTVDKD